MGAESKISWTNATFNPWRGCTKVSDGCAHCYAERDSKRNPGVLGVWGPQGTRVLASQAMWRQPYAWARQAAGQRRLVFCASLADVFEDWPGQMVNAQGRPLWQADLLGEALTGPVATLLGGQRVEYRPFGLAQARELLWSLIRHTPGLTWLLLTKRPENIARMMPGGSWPNVWLGASVETQEFAWRLDALVEAREHIRVPVLWCSAEPLLGELNLSGQLGPAGVSWVIGGGESGAADAVRECELGWLRAIRDQARAARAAFFCKQLGAVALDDRPSGLFQLPLIDRKGADPAEWPEDLRVQEFPS